MTIEYVSVADAMKRTGLRMIVVSDIPSPWGEAAKGILHMKGLPWAAVRLDYQNEALAKWAGQRSAPIVFHEDDAPRSGWQEILELAERLAPTPQLLPSDPGDRTLALTLAKDFCGENGLGWARRLQLIESGLNNAGGFPINVAKYLGKKYGHNPETAAKSSARVGELLKKFSARLKSQRKAGSRYYVGNSPTAVDIYSATFLAMFKPLAAADCKMDPVIRAVFESRDLQTEASLDSILFEHRETMYGNHLELPLSL